MSEIWELWYPDAGATGLLVARARIAPTRVVWAHAVPEKLVVVVRDAEGAVIARSETQRSGERYPMTRLERRDRAIVREDRWPSDPDLGTVVILPGGEAGLLRSWWNEPDGSSWRWQVELSNHR